MAESDGKPASSPLSGEEADRLSEKFKPSWEAEPEPPTVPRVEPPVRPEPMISIEAPIPSPNPLKQTLLGVAAPAPEPPPTALPGKAPDDLDWELPTNPSPTALEETQPIEPPPKSNPSGMGEKYVPKETGAPAIVLTDEVKRAEEHARAQLAAEHRARSAPTVLKLKAIDVQPKAAASDDDDDLVLPKRRLGVWIGLVAGAAAVGLIGLLLLVRGPSSPAPEAPPPPVKAEAPPPPPVATPVPPPPLPPEPEQATPPASAEPRKEPLVEPLANTPPEPAAKPVKPAARPATPPKVQKPVAATPKPATAPPKPTQAPPKPVAPAPKPATKPAAGGIVRDAPF